MMPYDTYRLYQAERAKSPAELQCAGEQAARLASAVSSLLRTITQPVRAAGGPHPSAGRAGTSRLAEPAACRDAMAG
jgi:hypothetical protein